MIMPTNEERQNVLMSMGNLKSTEWIVMVRYMGKELASTDQSLLAEIICQEAERRAINSRHVFQTERGPSDFIAGILSEVGMRIVPA